MPHYVINKFNRAELKKFSIVYENGQFQLEIKTKPANATFLKGVHYHGCSPSKFQKISRAAL